LDPRALGRPRRHRPRGEEELRTRLHRFSAAPLHREDVLRAELGGQAHPRPATGLAPHSTVGRRKAACRSSRRPGRAAVLTGLSAVCPGPPGQVWPHLRSQGDPATARVVSISANFETQATSSGASTRSANVPVETASYQAGTPGRTGAVLGRTGQRVGRSAASCDAGLPRPAGRPKATTKKSANLAAQPRGRALGVGQAGRPPHGTIAPHLPAGPESAVDRVVAVDQGRFSIAHAVVSCTGRRSCDAGGRK